MPNDWNTQILGHTRLDPVSPSYVLSYSNHEDSSIESTMNLQSHLVRTPVWCRNFHLDTYRKQSAAMLHVFCSNPKNISGSLYSTRQDFAQRGIWIVQIRIVSVPTKCNRILRFALDKTKKFLSTYGFNFRHLLLCFYELLCKTYVIWLQKNQKFIKITREMTLRFDCWLASVYEITYVTHVTYTRFVRKLQMSKRQTYTIGTAS